MIPLRVAAVLAILFGAAACGDRENRVGDSPPLDARAGGAQPIARLVFEDEAARARPETRVYLARQYHRTTARLPYRTGDRPLAVGPDNTVALGELVDVAEIAPEATGIAYAFYDPFNGPVYGVYTFDETQPIDELAGTRLSVVPDAPLNRPFFPEAKVTAWAREILPLPIEERTTPLRIPEGARLLFSATPEYLTEGMKPHNNPAARSPAADDRALTIRVQLETDTGSTEVYRATLPSPSIWNEAGFSEDASPLANVHQADLSAWSGQAARLVFRIEEANAATSSAGLTTASWVLGNLYVIGATPPAESSRPNLILISLDTLRADHLGCYGYDAKTSPNLDALARQAVLFERCMASASWTTASHATVFTGLPTSLHRADGFSHTRLREHFTTLAELAKERDYLTAAFTEGIAMAGDRGFNQGFDLYSDGFGTPLKPGSAGKTFAHGKAWLERFGALPFFLYLHTYEIHSPYQAPEPFRDRFAPGAPQSIIPNAQERSEIMRQHTINMYDAEIAYTDHVLGDFLAFLDEAGYLENTTVIIFSDHGEEFWEHRGVTHGKTLYQEQLHVPLIIRPAGGITGGTRVSRLVGLTDVFATVVETMRWEAPIPDSSLSLHPFFSDLDSPDYDRALSVASQRSGHHSAYRFAIQTPDWKYIASAHYKREDVPIVAEGDRTFEKIELPLAAFVVKKTGAPRELPVREELFNLDADPREAQNLAATDPAELSAARNRFRDYVRSIAGDPLLSTEAQEKSAPLSDRQIQDLRALGYLE